MTEALADCRGRPTEKLCNLYERWSEGGVGTLITGNIQVDRRYVERPGNVCIDGEQDKKSLEMLTRFASAGKGGGRSRIIAQISHAGRQANGMVNMSPVGPGNVRCELPKIFLGTPRALEESEVRDVVRRFADAASVCEQCGFDGVQIHAAHGYLLSSFLNPRANNRPELFGPDDQFGGSLENRARPLLEVVRAVRAAVRDNFAVMVKLNSADFQKGGFVAEEAAKVAAWLEEEGIDLLEISGGNYEAGIYKEITEEGKPSNKSQSTLEREAYFLGYAVQIERVLTKLPVMVTGGWRSRQVMEQVLESRDCALFGLGRPLCAAPDSPKQLLAGDVDELPRYEESIKVGWFFLRWIFILPFLFCRLLHLLSLQSWYYRNIVAIAETGKADENLGPVSSLLANMKHEAQVANNLQGVHCVGSVYKGAEVEAK